MVPAYPGVTDAESTPAEHDEQETSQQPPSDEEIVAGTVKGIGAEFGTKLAKYPDSEALAVG